MSQPAELEKPVVTGTESGQPRTIAAGEFKAKCLKLLDEVAETREAIIALHQSPHFMKQVPSAAIGSRAISR